MASKRDQREYAERPVPKDAVRRILDGGRIAGSAKNRQPWRFLVLADRGLVDQVAQTVHAPPNLLGAPLVIAIVVSGKGPVAFDAGRAAQNMMLAAWNGGVVSTPNGIANPESLAELLGLEADEQVQDRAVACWVDRGRGQRMATSAYAPVQVICIVLTQALTRRSVDPELICTSENGAFAGNNATDMRELLVRQAHRSTADGDLAAHRVDDDLADSQRPLSPAASPAQDGTHPRGQLRQVEGLAHALFVPGLPGRRKLGPVRGDRSALGDECVKRSRRSN